MNVLWSARARRDLLDILEFIAGENPDQAHAVVDDIAETVERLEIHPAMGRPGRVAGTRELVLPRRGFIVPYRIDGDTIMVLRVIHTSRDWPGGISR